MILSIIIVSYNTKELIADCLNSIKNAKKPKETEIFVVDNKSHDGTPDLIKERYPQVNLIISPQNVGFSKGNNIALKKAQGKFILILNPDTKIAKDTLISMIEFMDTHQNFAVSTCKVLLPDGSLDRDCRRRFPTPWRALNHFLLFEKVFARSKTFDQYYMGYLPDTIEHEIDSCVGAFMFVRKSAIDKVGLFDEDFFFYGEDLDWCWRFKQAGYKIYYTPITQITHYKGAASGMKPTSQHLTKATKESKKRALFESVRAMELFYKKHLSEKYPFIINWLVLTALKLLKSYRVSLV